MMKKVLVVSSDPGVTGALLPVARELIRRKVNVHIIASGPAIKIWQQAQLQCDYDEPNDSVTEADAMCVIEVHQPDVVVVGAGAYNRIEHTFRRAASARGIFCFALLDFWANYHLRFRREFNGSVTYSLPDLIGVMDEYCYKEMVAEGFDPKRLVIVGAPHLEESVNFVTSAPEVDIELWRDRFELERDIATSVFFSQTMPRFQSNDVAEYYGGEKLPPWGFTQRTILREVVQALSSACMKYGVRAQLVLKPHPMEPVEPLSQVFQTTEVSPLLDCRIIGDCDALRLICLADVVLSMSSTALLEAALAGKPALSVQIGMDVAKHPDDFYGNHIGITTPIYEAVDLRRALGEILCKSQRIVNVPVRPSFDGSTTKVVETILTYCDSNMIRSHTED